MQQGDNPKVTVSRRMWGNKNIRFKYTLSEMHTFVEKATISLYFVINISAFKTSI